MQKGKQAGNPMIQSTEMPVTEKNTVVPAVYHEWGLTENGYTSSLWALKFIVELGNSNSRSTYWLFTESGLWDVVKSSGKFLQIQKRSIIGESELK